MAAMMPIAFLLVMVVMLIFVLYLFAAFANERRLLEIIRKLQDEG